MRSDVYALGMLLYYLLTEEVPSPRLAGGAFDEPGVPVALRPVLARATAFDPAARYPSVRALCEAFMAACAGPQVPGASAMAQGASEVAGALPAWTGGGAGGGSRIPTAGEAAVAPVFAGRPEHLGVSGPEGAGAARAAAGEPPRRNGGKGAARTVAAFVLAALFLMGGIGEALDPKAGSSMAQYAPSVRWIGVIAVELIFVAVFYPLADRRWLGRQLGRTLPRPGRTALALVAVGLALFALMMALNGDFAS